APPTTRFPVSTTDGPRRLEVYDLEYQPPKDSEHLTTNQLAARGLLRELYAALTDLPAALGPGAGPSPPPPRAGPGRPPHQLHPRRGPGHRFAVGATAREQRA